MHISPEDWKIVDSVFQDCVDASPTEQQRRIEQAANGRDTIRRHIREMLDADASDVPGKLDRSIPTTLFGEVAFDEVAIHRFGPWRGLEQIAHGGMGIVFRGCRADGAYEQEVAIKKILGSRDPEAIEQFAAERQVLARLSHSNIARLVDGGTTESGDPYLVMELVRGEPIDRYCEARNLPCKERVRLMIEVCRAVEHAHRNLIVHGDLKPQNVFVDHSGTAKLLDFGISRLIDIRGRAPAADSAARPGPVTLDYASPEQLRGQPLTTYDDVYSLGLLLRCVLTGIRPPDTCTTQLPSDLDAIIAKACQDSQSNRYASVAALARDLERHLQHLPVSARPWTIPYCTRRFLRRNALPSLLTAIAVFGLSTALVVSFRGGVVAAADRDAAQAAQRSANNERIHAEIEAESASLANNFLAAAFLGSETVTDERRQKIAAFAHEKAAQLRLQFAANPHLRANLLDSLGGLMRRLHDPKSAANLIREAMEVRRASFGEQSLEYALSLTSLGELHSDAGRHGLALREFQAAYAIHQRSQNAVHCDCPGAAHDVGRELFALGHYDDASQMLKTALQLPPKPGGTNVPETAEIHETLAKIGMATDAPEIARTHYEECLRLRQTCLGDNDPATQRADQKLVELAQEASTLPRDQSATAAK